MRRRMPWIAAAVLAAVVVAVVIGARRAPREPDVTQAPPAVQVATVRYGDYAVTLQEAGHVGAPAGATGKAVFAVSGILQSIEVRVGEYISQGTPIATLDTRTLALDAQQLQAEAAAAAAAYAGGTVPQAQIGAAQAQEAAARDRVATDRAQVQREQRLYAGGVAAYKDVQAAQSQLAADQAQVSVTQAGVQTAGSQPHVLAAQAQAAQARAAAAQHAFEQGTLYAPSSGIVTAIFKHVGEAVDPTTPVLSIGPAAQREVTLDVPSSDAQQIRVGNPATLTVTGGGDGAGRVTAVVPSVDPGTQSATVVASGAPSGAVAGSAVQARITIAHVRGMLVPESAIVQDPQNGSTVVFVRERRPDGLVKFVQRAVVVRHEDGTTAQIAGSVQSGAQVAAQGAFSLLAPAGQ